MIGSRDERDDCLFDTECEIRAGLHPVDLVRAHARRHPLRHRLAIVAPNTVDAVRYAGGFIFDRMMGGWEVVAVLTEHDDVRPLEILGATVLDLTTALASPVHATWPESVLLAPDVFVTNEWVRRGAIDCLDKGLTELAVWGDDLPDELACRVFTAHHRLSTAARAFKRCALGAAGIPERADENLETFHSGEVLLADLRGRQALVRAV
ncbi:MULTISPECIES: hypothetical protein [Nocardia]|uniref:hypothetical protein n=1 Tax=Nocardia TaxID=1817 RepID=UPI001893CD4B|nr:MULTISPECIES: hypothetical protein [Nocardia]MBF6352264.1 hypothetical protein [Nocardia flavorosea]